MKTIVSGAIAFMLFAAQMPAQSIQLSLSSLVPNLSENGPGTDFDKESALLYHAGLMLDNKVTQTVKSFVNSNGLTILVLALVVLTGLCWTALLSESSKLMGGAKRHFYEDEQTHLLQE